MTGMRDKIWARVKPTSRVIGNSREVGELREWCEGYATPEIAQTCGATEYTRSDLPPSAEVIRGMIKPLVWASIPEFAYVTTPHGQYQVRETENNGWYVQLDCLQVGVLEDGLESQNLGIEIANEHHANTILAALGLTEGKDK